MKILNVKNLWGWQERFTGLNKIRSASQISQLIII